ncbi:MAG: 5-formyltetrahydrofolate cyclo-ligase [Bdellovibrio sp.]|nr:MAG: 5-formyltetrahydrofolate cyclo-ligase [Bdellovibrio sp.]
MAPKVNGSELLFYPYTYGKTPLVRNQWGIWEPASNHDPVALSHCHFVCVPGVAFDREGGRLGYGKGYYDRALQGYEGVKIGVAYAQQVSEKPLPLDDHDVLMDALVTEEFFLIFNERD